MLGFFLVDSEVANNPLGIRESLELACSSYVVLFIFAKVTLCLGVQRQSLNRTLEEV